MVNKKELSILLIALCSFFISGCTGTVHTSPTTPTSEPSSIIPQTSEPSSIITQTSELTSTEQPLVISFPVSFVLTPSDIGQDWSYEVKIEDIAYGSNPQYSQNGSEVELGIRQVVIKDNTATIEEFYQFVEVYPSLKEANNSLKGFNQQPLDAGHWDAVYQYTKPGESFEYVGIVFRKDNCVMHLEYKEVLYSEDPLTGKFYRIGLQQFNQEKAQWAEDLINNLAEIVISRQS